MGIRTWTAEVETKGANGSAQGSKETGPITGKLGAVEIDYIGVPSTTKVDIDEVLSGGVLGRKILNAPASNTDVTYYPHAQAQDVTGVPLTYDETRIIPVPFYIGGRNVRVTVTLSDAAPVAVRVRLIVEY